MNYEGNYCCWTAICKNEKCGQTLLLEVIGPAEKFRRPYLPLLTKFKITCPDCKIENSYDMSDVKEKNLLNPPKEYRCIEFLNALKAATEARQVARSRARRITLNLEKLYPVHRGPLAGGWPRPVNKVG